MKGSTYICVVDASTRVWSTSASDEDQTFEVIANAQTSRFPNIPSGTGDGGNKEDNVDGRVSERTKIN